ncbi:ABC transporter substrate-binding protein [Methylobacterium oryzisoli]|uniref:ABC transporter substrate-binding protein n=1 Tax=Methylobacterium oryzisoli TaxID=3385502 RepID=UPI003891B84B
MERIVPTETGGPSRRAALGLVAGAASLALGAPSLRAAPQKVRIGLATKTWWPSVLADVAVKRGLFAKAGLDPELTVYRSGGEAFEAQAAGAADIITGLVSQIATGRSRGVNTKILALSASANTGWRLLVKTGSPIKDVKDIAGKKVGITTAGSLSDFMALWTRAQYKLDFVSVPLGGGGLVPNLLSGNVDAGVVYSPLSFQTLQAKQTVSLLDYATAIPSHLAVSWSAPDALIDKQPEMLRAALKALYGAVSYLQQNRDDAIKIIAEVNGISEPVAAQEFDETFLKLSPDGRFTAEQVQTAEDLARLGGFKNLAPPDQIYTSAFTPVIVA